MGRVGANPSSCVPAKLQDEASLDAQPQGGNEMNVIDSMAWQKKVGLQIEALWNLPEFANLYKTTIQRLQEGGFVLAIS